MNNLFSQMSGARIAVSFTIVLLAVALIVSLSAAVVPGVAIGAGGSALANFVP